MTKTQFLNIIRYGLRDLPENEVNEILYDYEEHFANGLSDGKTEEEIIDELGDPYCIIEQYKSSNIKQTPKTPKKTNTIDNNVLIAIIICVVCFPAITGVAGCLIGLICVISFVPIGLTFAGLAAILVNLGVTTFGFAVPAFIADFPLSVTILFTLGSLFGAILGVILSVYLIKGLVVIIKKIIEGIKGKTKKGDVEV